MKRIHAQVSGTLADGTSYRAADPHLLAWVHVAGASMFLEGWRRYGEPGMSGADQDRYFAEAGEVARLLGRRPGAVHAARGRKPGAPFSTQSSARTIARARSATSCSAAPAASLKDAPVQKLLMSAAATCCHLGTNAARVAPPVLCGAADPRRDLRPRQHLALGIRTRGLSLSRTAWQSNAESHGVLPACR